MRGACNMGNEDKKYKQELIVYFTSVRTKYTLNHSLLQGERLNRVVT
jgi:hypothetical protein